jgi:hypothetical protein
MEEEIQEGRGGEEKGADLDGVPSRAGGRASGRARRQPARSWTGSSITDAGCWPPVGGEEGSVQIGAAMAAAVVGPGAPLRLLDQGPR